MKRSIDIGPVHLRVVLGALVGLWASSCGLHYAPRGSGGHVAAAGAIATAQLVLVLVFFMELGQHRGGLRIVALTAPLWVAILVLLMLGDVWAR